MQSATAPAVAIQKHIRGKENAKTHTAIHFSKSAKTLLHSTTAFGRFFFAALSL